MFLLLDGFLFCRLSLGSIPTNCSSPYKNPYCTTQASPSAPSKPPTHHPNFLHKTTNRKTSITDYVRHIYASRTLSPLSMAFISGPSSAMVNHLVCYTLKLAWSAGLNPQLLLYARETVVNCTVDVQSVESLVWLRAEVDQYGGRRRLGVVKWRQVDVIHSCDVVSAQQEKENYHLF